MDISIVKKRMQSLSFGLNLDFVDLDLIMMNEHSDPPVCKIANWSKYRYNQEKKAKELKKNSKATEIKEVKMSYKIDVHDYGVRMKNALKFLNQGNRVKCTVMFRGREVQHDQLGFELLDKLSVDLEHLANREGRPKREGRNLSLILSPRPEVLKTIAEKRRSDEKAKKMKKKESFESRQAAKNNNNDDANSVAAAAAVSGTASSTPNSSSGVATMELAGEGVNGSSSDDTEVSSIINMESSLDELLGGTDDLTDDIFS